MRLFDATLDLARNNQGLFHTTITAADSDSKWLWCEGLDARMGEFGTIWFLDGNSAGVVAEIESCGNQKIILKKSLDTTYDFGDNVALSASRDFDIHDLINAINHILYSYPIMAYYSNEKFVYDHKQREYELDRDITTDIRRVQIQSSVDPYNLITCHYWRSEPGRLIIYKHSPAYKEGGMIRISYAKPHGYVTPDVIDFIDPQVDREYLRLMATLYLWNNEIVVRHKDNLVATDMFNQAKLYEDSIQKKNIPEKNLLPKDFVYQW